MLQFIKHFDRPLSINLNEPVLAFYTGHSKVFDSVPHEQVSTKTERIRVGGVFFDILSENSECGEQFIWLRNQCSAEEFPLWSCVPQGPLLVPLFSFQRFNLDHETDEPYYFADDLHNLHEGNPFWTLQKNVTKVGKSFTNNETDLASDKCEQLVSTGKSELKILKDQPLRTFTTIRDWDVLINTILCWSSYINERR